MREKILESKKGKMTTKFIAITGITAAVYIVATLMIAPFAYGDIQFRLSEILVLLAFIDKKYSAGLILGCMFSNFFSPLGVVDVVFGTMGTVCTTFAVSRTKNLFTATLWPTFFCVWVGLELAIFSNMPFIFTTATVMLGEFAVVTLIGYPVFRKIISNDFLMEKLKID